MEDAILACKERGADPVSEFSVSSRKRDQIKGILVLVSKPESEDNKSRSRLDA